jgi:trans-aconitate 2-methyltransferase
MPWDPDRYHQFWKERSAPFEDLFGLITVREGLQVVDLGCGTGELTRKLAERLPGSDVLGIDVSPEMLARASELKRPSLRFELGSIEAVEGAWDVVFSHAAIQWVDDHRLILAFSLVRPAGSSCAAPSNFRHPTHTIIQEIAGQEPSVRR